MWAVMTGSAKMPTTCWGRYRRRVALPLAISRHGPSLGEPRASCGSPTSAATVSARQSAQRTLAEAERRARELNNAPTVEEGDELLASWGGSSVMAEPALEFVFEELREVRAEQSRTRDSITVLTGITIRLEGAVSGLTMEIAGLRSMVLDHVRRLRNIEKGA